MTSVPHSPQAEEALLGRLLATPARIGEIVGTLLEPAHFYLASNQLLYGALVEAFFADDPIDPLTIGELHAKPLSRLWGLSEQQAVARVVALGAAPVQGAPADHAALIRRDADYRALLALTDDIRERVLSERAGPTEIAGLASQRAMQIAVAQTTTQELVSFEQAGRAFAANMRVAMAARAQGVELGVYYGLKAIDMFARGHRPGELIMAAGEPGVGKTSVWLKGALNFATRQAERPAGQRVATLIVSLEMTPEPSNARFASMLTGTPGVQLREGTLSARTLARIMDRWRERNDIPLYLNYAPTLRASQLRALVSEGIRRHNVGLVVIDHFRMFDLDERLPNRLDEDEEKARFLKEQIALTLNVAVVCLAHTRKPDQNSNGRPRMSDMRGSYQVAAHSDLISFIYRPAMYASKEAIADGEVSETDAEMIWAKNRMGDPGTAPFFFNASLMQIVDE